MALAIASTGATRTLKVSVRREAAGQSSISMMENRVLRRYQGETRRRGESDSQTHLPRSSVSRNIVNIR
jgi:hypothetical protein